MILEGEIKDAKMQEQFFIWLSNTHETLIRLDSTTDERVEKVFDIWNVYYYLSKNNWF